jgi:EmrB/QacA subfamily drug resistance transporter
MPTGSSGLRLAAALFAVAAGLFMGLLDLSIVTIVIPEIGRALDAEFTQLSWVINAYVLATAALIIPAGKLGDVIGRKRVFAAGMAIFAAASLLCGLAPNAETLIVFRALQGVGGAAMVTLSLAILTYMLPEDKRAMGYSLWGAVGGLALATGPSLGGLLTEFATWRWVFIINLPIAAVALPLVVFVVPERRGEGVIGAKVDWAGLITVVAGLATLSLGLLQGQQWGWDSPRIIALLATSGVLLTAFFVIESVVAEPMVPLRYFGNLRFSAACAGWFGAMFAFISIFFFLPVFLEVVQGYSVLKASLALSPGPFTSFLIAPLAGLASRRIGPSPLALTGLAIICAGVLVTSQVETDWSYGRLIVISSCVGVGFGMAVPTLTELAMGAVSASDAGIGAGVFNTIRQVAAVVAVSSLGAVLQQRMVVTFSDALAASTVIPESLRDTVQREFETRATQRSGLEGVESLPPELAAEIQRLASLALVDGLQAVFVVAGSVCVAALAFAAALLLRARLAAEPSAEPVVLKEAGM